MKYSRSSQRSNTKDAAAASQDNSPYLSAHEQRPTNQPPRESVLSQNSIRIGETRMGKYTESPIVIPNKLKAITSRGPEWTPQINRSKPPSILASSALSILGTGASLQPAIDMSPIPAMKATKQASDIS